MNLHVRLSVGWSVFLSCFPKRGGEVTLPCACIRWLVLSTGPRAPGCHVPIVYFLCPSLLSWLGVGIFLEAQQVGIMGLREPRHTRKGRPSYWKRNLPVNHHVSLSSNLLKIIWAMTAWLFLGPPHTFFFIKNIILMPQFCLWVLGWSYGLFVIISQDEGEIIAPIGVLLIRLSGFDSIFTRRRRWIFKIGGYSFSWMFFFLKCTLFIIDEMNAHKESQNALYI